VNITIDISEHDVTPVLDSANLSDIAIRLDDLEIIISWSQFDALRSAIELWITPEGEHL
jgi:hypothetical protein